MPQGHNYVIQTDGGTCDNKDTEQSPQAHINGHFGQYAVKHLGVVPGRTLDESGDGKNRKETGETEHDKSKLKIYKFIGIHLSFARKRQDMPESAQCDEAGKSEDGNMGVADSPVVEMRNFLETRQ